MATFFKTKNPRALLSSFDQRISQKELNGKITTWEKDADGDYTHKASEWHRKAWFRPRIENGQLTFNIIKPVNVKMSSIVYAYYHGHLMETFLNHFDVQFSEASATALPVPADQMS